MRNRFLRTARRALPLLVLLAFLFCSRVDEKPQPEVILARVKDRSISLHEFMQRAEYTLRPPFCRGNTPIDKNIVLNTLIAEKLFALEAGDANELTESRRFNHYIIGRQEQAMRQWLLNKEGFEKVKLNQKQLNSAYELAGRTYHLQYFNIPDQKSAQRVSEWLIQPGQSFDDVFDAMWGLDSIPERDENYFLTRNDLMHNALFSAPLEKGQVIGPIRTDDQIHTLIRIKGWTERPAITETESVQRKVDVATRLKEKQAFARYEKFVSRQMQGKRLQLSQDTFFQFAEIVKPIYLVSNQQVEDLFLQAAFQKPEDNPILMGMDQKLEALANQPLLNMDDEVWTVQRFREELERHPLVFRKKKLSSSEFAEQLRFAIADLVRDKHLTAAAYQRGYDRAASVQRYTQMWRDALLALYQKGKVLEGHSAAADSLSAMMVLETCLNPYVSQLQEKYSQDIELNVDPYNAIKLTRIDMFVLQENVPYPVVVPSFPQLTTNHALQYGRRMEQR